ncbi:MAG: LPXTG cell wall anchor domain-containing protein, partial [Olsenella sp.]
NTGDSISAGMMVLLALSGAAALLVARRRSEKE